MAQKKPSFRFRIPWLSSGVPEQSRRSKDKPKSPPHSDINVPIQRPTRPSVITPAESPPSPSSKTQIAPITEPQNQSPPKPTPSSVVIDTPVTTQSKPPSPPPAHQPLSNADPPSHVHIFSSSPTTQLHSPSHSASDDAMKVPKPAAEESTHPASSEQEKEKMVVSEPMPQETEPELKVNSPLKTINKSPETSFQSESKSSQPAGSEQQASSMPSSSPVSKTEPVSQLHPSPSPMASKPKSPETSFQPESMPSQPAGSAQHASSMPSSSPVSKTEPASQPYPSPPPIASKPINEVLSAKPEEKDTSPTSSISQKEKEKMAVAVSEPVPEEAEPKMKSPLKIIPKSEETSSQPENLSTQPTPTLSNEERSISATPKTSLENQSKILKPEEKEKVVQETKKVRKGKDTTTGQPTRRTIASASGTKTKDKKQHEARETVERKIMFATSNSSGKDIRVVSSTDQGKRNVSSLSPQRTVSSNEEKAPLQKGIKDDISNFVHKLTSMHQTQPTEDKQFSIITLAGDNRGATMNIGSESANKEGSIHIHRDYKTDPEESTEVTTEGEENTDTNEDSQSPMEQDEVEMAYVNSNIQSINNSLMVHGSITERDPGVQVTLPQKPADPTKPHDKDAHRTEFNINRAQKSTYQPMVRRRSLRGPVLEPSDSDPDNLDEPRSHGCKFTCGKNIEDIEIM